MIIDILTLFPEMFHSPFNASVLKKACDKGLVEIKLINIRDFSCNKHHTVDDAPYGGGVGMVIGPEPLFKAVDWVCKRREGLKTKIIFLCPQGKTFNQAKAKELAREEHLVMICGHYEGIDERVREHLVDDEISIGDFVLTGGELPAMVVVDAVARLIPGVLGKESSARNDSFYYGLLDYPHYTRPREFRGYTVPEVLLSGHHEQIRRWRRKQSLLRTLERRPDLLLNAPLTEEDKAILKEVLRFLQELKL